MNPPPSSYDEALRTYQQESRELKVAHKRSEARLNDLTELFRKFASQMAVNNKPPSNSKPFPSQPLPIPKGGINMVQNTNDDEEEEDSKEEEEDSEEEEEEEDDEWLYDLLAKLAEIDSDSEDEYEVVEEEEVTEENEEEEMTEIIKEATEEEVGNPDKEEEFFIATVYGGNEENLEDLPEKCVDPGPCFVTCKKVLDLGPLKKKAMKLFIWPTQVRSNNETNPQVHLGRPFLKTAGFKLNFHNETFSREVRNVIEIFQPTRPPISEEESEEEAVVATDPKETAKRAVTPKLKKDKKNPTPARKNKQKKEDTKAVKKKKPEKEREERNA
ncbi:hypothetical protein PIB30_091733 [Stylosanthes scabra]|uniref:Uncharacterized protein n=1 Tax=Stylosanthes scabra TaxID=79078 RepID=A0ABU6ZTA6_9FABA|nr:hypothetical protein [Stylosanthes scabra]